MKKNLFKILAGTMILTFTFSISSFAGSWQASENNWKYQNNDGSYVTNSWVTENNEHYYFDANGIMLKNTLSPDGYPLGRDGKRIQNDEKLPSSFSGSETEFASYSSDALNFCDGYNKNFNDTYDEVMSGIVNVYKNQDFDNAKNAINRIDSYDFSTYMNSENAIIRKLSTASEIFRIEQVYYMSEIVNAAQQQDENTFSSLCDKLMLSVDKYADNSIAIIDQLASWDIY